MGWVSPSQLEIGSEEGSAPTSQRKFSDRIFKQKMQYTTDLYCNKLLMAKNRKWGRPPLGMKM